MVCPYCNKRLGIVQRLKGLSFCSVEHQDLYFGLSFERLRESVSEYAPNRRVQPANQELAQAEPVVDPQRRNAAQESSSTFEIASLIGSIGTNAGSDLPEAPFLPELSASQDRPAFPLKSYAREAVSTTVQLAESLTDEVPLRALPSIAQDVSLAQPQVEITSISNQTTWSPVPQGYPPAIVSASATFLLDPNEAKLIPLPLGEPCRGEAPAPPSETAAIHVPLRYPLMPSRQPSSHASTTVTRLPHEQGLRSFVGTASRVVVFSTSTNWRIVSPGGFTADHSIGETPESGFVFQFPVLHGRAKHPYFPGGNPDRSSCISTGRAYPSQSGSGRRAPAVVESMDVGRPA